MAARDSLTVTEITDFTSRLSATALTGRLSASMTSKRTVDWLGSSAPRHCRGRNALTGVSARSGV